LRIHRFTVPPPPVRSLLSLHDALPICRRRGAGVVVIPRPGLGRPRRRSDGGRRAAGRRATVRGGGGRFVRTVPGGAVRHVGGARSEEHTSELQSRENLVCRLLLEKKKK